MGLLAKRIKISSLLISFSWQFCFHFGDTFRTIKSYLSYDLLNSTHFEMTIWIEWLNEVCGTFAIKYDVLSFTISTYTDEVRFLYHFLFFLQDAEGRPIDRPHSVLSVNEPGIPFCNLR